MDERRFDDLATTLAEQRSRRGFSRLLAGSALGAFAVIALREAGDAKAHGGQQPASGRGPAAKKAQHDRATAAAAGSGAVGATRKRKRRCRTAQSLCATNGQCCPSTTGYVCGWNGNAEATSVCCGVANARCFGDWDCCGRAICLFGVCTNLG